MQIQFKNTLFDINTYDFAVVSDNKLVIVLKTRDITLEFKTSDEAFDALAELAVVLSNVKDEAPQFSDVIQEAAGTVSKAFNGFVGRLKTTGDSLEARVSKMVDDVDKVLNEVRSNTKPKTQDNSRPRDTTQDAESVFGTSRNKTPSDVTIAELSDNALRVAINNKTEYLIENDVRVKSLLENLRQFHSDDQISEVIDYQKRSIFTIARDNDHMTINELFAELLRSI